MTTTDTRADRTGLPEFATFAELLRSRQDDQKVGLRFEDDSWTWAGVVQESADRAAALLASVPRPEGRQLHVGILLDNVPDYVFWIGACGLAGAVVVGLNSSRSGPEIAEDARHADVDLVVTEGRFASLLTGVDLGVFAGRVLDVDSDAYAAWLGPHHGAALPDVSPRPEDIALLLFSSGSTGKPKAVIVGQDRLARLARAIGERVELDRDAVTYLYTPLFHGHAVMMNLVPAWSVGACVGMARRFSASQFSADVHRFGVTFCNYVGRALSYVLAHPEDPRDHTSTLRLAYGTEASEADIASFSARFGCRVQEGYGLSEGVFRINRTEDTPPGALGVPAGGLDVRILDEETGEECPRAVLDDSGRLQNPEAVGQMVAIGLAHTFEGYYKNPGAMAERVRGDDFWSGDLGYRDADGWFYFAGRSSEWLRVDSENFAAAQVERVLRRFPGVVAAPVYAVPDPVTGDRVMCAVEMEEGQPFDAGAFGRFLDGQPDMGAKWWPSFVRVVDRVPFTGSGKVDKAPLRLVAWSTASDPVYARVQKAADYVPLDEAARDELEASFRRHGRSSRLPMAEGEV